MILTALVLSLYVALFLLVLVAVYAYGLREQLARSEAERIRETARADQAEDRYAERRFSLAPSVSTEQGWTEDVILRDWWAG